MSIPAQSAATSHEEQALAAAGVVAYERRRGYPPPPASFALRRVVAGGAGGVDEEAHSQEGGGGGATGNGVAVSRRKGHFVTGWNTQRVDVLRPRRRGHFVTVWNTTLIPGTARSACMMSTWLSEAAQIRAVEPRLSAALTLIPGTLETFGTRPDVRRYSQYPVGDGLDV